LDEHIREGVSGTYCPLCRAPITDHDRAATIQAMSRIAKIDNVEAALVDTTSTTFKGLMGGDVKRIVGSIIDTVPVGKIVSETLLNKTGVWKGGTNAVCRWVRAAF
jgi:hypothetical protein